MPTRTCVACRQEVSPENLVRWVRDDQGEVFPDLSGRSFGRGAWVHPTPDCLKQLNRALSRSFRAEVTTSAEEAALRLAVAAAHRAQQLLGAGRRQNLLVFGADATQEAWSRGEVALVVVARDARSAADASYVAEAVRAGRASVWGTKEQLGHLFGRPEVGVLGVRDRGLAGRLFGAIAMALLVPLAAVEERTASGS